MPIDPYSPCLGGTGKKMKFCCADLMPELDKVLRMLGGDQTTACLDYVRKLDEKHPGRACLQSIRVQLENATGDHAAADSTLASFLAQHPDNAVALAEKAIHVAAHDGDPLAAVAWLQKGLEASAQDMPVELYRAMGSVAVMLISAGHYLPARGLAQLQVGISQGRDERATSMLLQMEASSSAPLPMKEMRPLENAPDGVPWQRAFQEALKSAQKAHWKRAAESWTALESQAANSPALWRNLAIVRGYLGDYEGAAEALRKYTALEVPLDEAVEAEALAQLFTKEEAHGQVDELSLTYPLTDAEAVQEKFAADRRFQRLPLDPSAWTAKDEPPPRAAFALLDRPALATGVGITREQAPHQLGELLLFGKQTDREARLELSLYRTELTTAQKLLQEALGDLLGAPEPEKIVGHLSQIEHALSWHWRLPDDTPEELRHSLSLEQRKWLVLESWPKIPQPMLGGRTPELAATEPQYHMKLLAAIWLLQLSDADQSTDVYNELRRKLNLPELAEIDATGLDVNGMPLQRIARLKIESLSDEQLQQAFSRAVVSNFVLAIRRLAPALIKRPDVPVVEYKLPAYRLLVRMAATSAEALRLIAEARDLAEANEQSSAQWDLMELSYRIGLGESAAASRLFDHIRRQHGREPGVNEALVRLLMQMGLISPDGQLIAPPEDAAPPSPLVTAGAATEPGKLWTPETAQPTGEKKSALWVPD